HAFERRAHEAIGARMPWIRCARRHVHDAEAGGRTPRDHDVGIAAADVRAAGFEQHRLRHFDDVERADAIEALRERGRETRRHVLRNDDGPRKILRQRHEQGFERRWTASRRADEYDAVAFYRTR